MIVFLGHGIVREAKILYIIILWMENLLLMTGLYVEFYGFTIGWHWDN